MPKKAESAEAVSEPEVRGDPASGSESAAPEAAAGEPEQAAPHAPAARFIALRNLSRNGIDYLPGDVVDMTLGRLEQGGERGLAAHIEELKASGAIKEA
jgi:hypothetical protein